MRIGAQSRPRHLQGSNSLCTLHRREIEQELIQCFPSFQVIEEVLYGRSRPDEHGDATLNPWILLYDLFCHNDTTIRNGHANTLMPIPASLKWS